MTPGQEAIVIQTVTGRVRASELGPTQTHEHVIADQRQCAQFLMWRRPIDSLMILDEPDVMVDELKALKRAGGAAVVDCTLPTWGRDLRLLRMASEASGVRIVACSGYYVESCHPPGLKDRGIDDLVDDLVQELTEGGEGSAIRTGLLKVAVSRPRVDGAEGKATRVVARAQRMTGAAVTLHTTTADYETTNGALGAKIVDVLEEEGTDPGRVIVGHLDERIDIRELETLYARGVYLQFDLIGKEHFMLDRTRVDAIRWLAERGMTDRLLLSMDCSRKSTLRAYGGPGYRYLYEHFVPAMLQASISQETVRQILVENPARVLPFRSPTRRVAEAPCRAGQDAGSSAS